MQLEIAYALINFNQLSCKLNTFVIPCKAYVFDLL
jgi:hypothetical protein